MKRRVGAAILGAAGAVLPLVATAAEEAGTTFEAATRSMDPSTDWGVVMAVTAASVLGLFALVGVGFMYRRERHLDWEFQKPDAPHDDHH